MASMAECEAVMRVQQKRDTLSPDVPGAEWLAQVTDQELLRLCRARRRNVYGHDWRLQGPEGKAAISQGVRTISSAHRPARTHKHAHASHWHTLVIGRLWGPFVPAHTYTYMGYNQAWDFAVQHAKWREGMKMDEMLRECDFEQAAQLMSRPDALALVSPHVALLDAAALETLGLSSDGACQGPVLWARLAADDDDADAHGHETVRTLMHEVAAACEWANANLGMGVGNKAQVLLDLTQADDELFKSCAFVLWQKITRPRLDAMFWQILGRIQVASHPPLSPLPLDHYPATIERILIVVPARAAGAEAKDNMRIGLAVAPVWRFVQSLTRIPLADTLACSVLLDSETRAIMHITTCSTAQGGLDKLAQQARDGAAQACSTIKIPVPSPSTWTPRLVKRKGQGEVTRQVSRLEEDASGVSKDDDQDKVLTQPPSTTAQGSLLIQPRAPPRLSKHDSAGSKKMAAVEACSETDQGSRSMQASTSSNQAQSAKPQQVPQHGSMLIQPPSRASRAEHLPPPSHIAEEES
jgi:hypothetical protein